MGAHAIVIGIDYYPKPEWCLTGAVRDAVAFARWCVTAGGVDPKDLTLLLSPIPGGPPLSQLLKADKGAPDLSARSKDASRKSIDDILWDYRSGKGKDADRLWFFYAGHGLAPPVESPDAGPIVVPADENDLERYISTNPIGLELFRVGMADVNPPKEQFFFVDACRDVLEVKGNKVLSQQLIWDVRKIKDDQLATQCVFFATTAGNKAREIRGNGLFSRALLAALRGLGPELSKPTALPKPGQRPRKRLLFDDVVKFVTDAVKRDLTQIPGTQPSDLTAIVPYGGIHRLKGDVVIAEFAPDELPTVTVSAIIDPADALKSTRIEFLQYDEGLNEFTARKVNPAPVGPPVLEVTAFSVQGGRHFLRVTADGFEEENPEILVYEDKRFPITLRPRLAGPPPGGEHAEPPAGGGHAPIPPGGGHGAVRNIQEETTSAGGGTFVSESATATIIVRSLDQLARVAVVDGGGNELAKKYGFVRVPNLAPGPYFVSAELTAADRVEQTIHARPGQTHDISLDVASKPAGLVLTEGMKGTQIPLTGSYSHPSENFGFVANSRLGSILAYAAWAARWPASAGFHKLRAIGVDPLPSLKLQQSALQILVGDVAEAEAPFARNCRVQVESSGDPLMPGNVILLGSDQPPKTPVSLNQIPGLPVAQQGSVVLPPGQTRLRVEMEGFAPTSFALTLLPKFVTVLVISREENREIDIQQYFNPIDPMVPVHPEFPKPKPDDVRLVELGWRALQGRDPLDAIEYEGLLERKRSNPLLAIIAGYRMFGTEREEQFRETPEPPIDGGIGPSPLWNMVHLFPGLPDVHVLAGLYDAPRRDEHFKRAMDTGTPILVEGFWTLVEWLTEQAARERKPPPSLRQSVLPGTVWTTFTEAPRAQRIEGVHVVNPTGHSAGDPPDKLVAVARSVGRLEVSDAVAGGFLCTAFLVAPRLLLCPIHFAVKFAKEQPDGSWIMRQRLARVRFDLADASSERMVIRALRTLRPPINSEVDGGTLDRAALDECWPVLVLLSEPASAPPLIVASEPPEIGQRVAVVGFPRSDARIPSEMFAEHFTGSAGEKHIMPGAVLRSPGKSWTFDYDCFTADGTSGGPLVELQTGAVVGMHVAASHVLEGRKRGIAIALTHFSEELLSMPSEFETESGLE